MVFKAMNFKQFSFLAVLLLWVIIPAGAQIVSPIGTWTAYLSHKSVVEITPLTIYWYKRRSFLLRLTRFITKRYFFFYL